MGFLGGVSYHNIRHGFLGGVVKSPMPNIRDGDGDGMIYDGTPDERAVDISAKDNAISVDMGEVIVQSEYLGESGRQKDFQAVATSNGKTVGVLDYAIFKENTLGEWGETIVPKMVEVPDEFRRNGIATQLYESVLKEHGNAWLGLTSRTDDGSAFRESIDREHANRVRPNPLPEVPEMDREKWARLASKRDSGEITQDRYWELSDELTNTSDKIDRWNRTEPHWRVPGEEPSQ